MYFSNMYSAVILAIIFRCILLEGGKEADGKAEQKNKSSGVDKGEAGTPGFNEG